MAKTLANCSMWVDDVAIQSQTNQVAIQQTVAEVDTTTFNDAGMERLGGLNDSVISAAGFWDVPDPDITLHGDVGSILPVTVALTRAAAPGDIAYLLNAEIASLDRGAKVGAAFTFNLKCAGSGNLASGFIANNGVQTATGNGPIQQLPAVANSLQGIVANLHLIAFSGTPNLVLTLFSAALIGFGSPTLRATFNAINTSTGSQSIAIPGAITDQFWRFTWTITGGSPSVTFAAAVGYAP